MGCSSEHCVTGGLDLGVADVGAFLEADVDHSGCLDRSEFVHILKTDQLQLKPWYAEKAWFPSMTLGS